MEREAAVDFKLGKSVIGLWAGLLVGPIAVLVQLEANYALVLWACANNRTWLLHLVSLLALVTTVIVGALSFNNWRRLGSQYSEDEAGAVPRSRFMSLVGILVSALMLLVIIAQWIPILIFRPCER